MTFNTLRFGGCVSLALATFALGPLAHAAIYVVDAGNPAAADSSAGSEDAPWKTIQHAADVAGPGDTVFVCEGKYPEFVTLKKTGGEKEWLTFKSAPPRAAQLTGFNTGKAQYVRIEGFKLVNEDKNDKDIKVAVNVLNSDHVEILDNYIEGAGIQGGRTQKDDTKTHSPLAIRIAYNQLHRPQQGIAVAGDKWIVESNEIDGLHDYAPKRDCDYTRAFGDGHEYRYNYFHGATIPDIGKAHVDCIQYFDVHHETLTHLNVHDNVFTDFGEGFIGEMQFPDSASDLVFAHNLYYTAPPWGAWGLCNEEIPGLVSEGNTYYGIVWFGVGLDRPTATGGIIRNNLFQKIETAIQTKKVEAVREGNFLFEIKEDKGKAADDKSGVDPKMADPAKGNFRLTKESPAISGGAKGETAGALAWPNVYCVDPRHPAATDESFGYPGRPFKTLAKALATAQAGETILLRGGTYRELLRPATSNITIRPLENETVILSGADLVEGWKKDAGGWYATVANKPAKLVCDGKPFDNFAYDPAAKRLDFNTPATTIRFLGDPRIHVWETLTRDHAIDLSAAKSVTVENLTVTHTLGDPVVPGEGNSLKKLITIASPAGGGAPGEDKTLRNFTGGH